jgi:phage-related protein
MLDRMGRKAVRWMGDSRERLREFQDAVRFEIGQALYQAELGERHRSACAM